MEIDQQVGRWAVAAHVIGDKDMRVPGRAIQTECAAVQCLVVEHAQREPVRYFVGSLVGVPLDVCRFQSEDSVAESDVVVADRTSVFVRLQDLVSKRGVPGLPDHGPLVPSTQVRPQRAPVPRKPHCSSDVVVEGWREVHGQKSLGGVQDKVSAGLEQREYFLWKASASAQLSHLLRAYVSARRYREHGVARDLPKSVVAKPAKGELRANRLTGRAELTEQLRQVVGYIGVANQPIAALHYTAQRQEQKQRLVGCSSAAPLSGPDIAEELEEAISCHGDGQGGAWDSKCHPASCPGGRINNTVRERRRQGFACASMSEPVCCNYIRQVTYQLGTPEMQASR